MHGAMHKQRNDGQRHSEASTRIKTFRQIIESGFQVAVAARAGI
jgi:hypothetical protein